MKLCESGTPRQVQAAIDDGADVNAPDRRRANGKPFGLHRTALMYAAANNNLKIITLLLEGKAARDETGRTALMRAVCENAAPSVINALLEGGVDIEAQDETGHGKEEIRKYASKHYDIGFTLDEIRPYYEFDVSCQGSVPQAIVAFLENDSFEDVIRGAISIGGDSDTIAAIAGSLAEACYPVPERLRSRAWDKLDSGMKSAVITVNEVLRQNRPDDFKQDGGDE